MATRKEKRKAQKESSPVSAAHPSGIFGKSATWILIAFTFVLYAQSIRYEFVLDDYSIIVENADTKKGISGIAEIFTSSYRSGYTAQVSDAIYRPLPKTIFAILWDLFPSNPLPGHFVNVLGYALLIGLIYRWLLFVMPGRPDTVFAAAAFFSVLPIHTEVVANIKSLDEIAGLFFGIFALLLFHQWLRFAKTSRLVLSGLSFFLSLLCKESAITFLALFPLLLVLFEADKLKAKMKGIGIPLAVAIVYLIIRQSVLGDTESGRVAHPADNMLTAAPDELTRFCTAVALLGRYVFMSVLPTHLSFDNSIPQLVFSNPASVEFLLSSLVFVIALILFFSTRIERAAKFAIAFFFITVSVSSNLFIRIGTHWGERLMFAPSLAICILLALGIGHFFSNRRTAFISVCGLLLFAYSITTLARTPVWTNNLSLYESGLRDAPNSVRTNYYIGNYYVKEEVLKGLNKQERDCTLAFGIRHLEKAIQLEKSFPDPWRHLGIAYFRKGDHARAIEAYRTGLGYFPDDPVTYNNMATSLVYSNRHAEALEAYARAVQLKPDYAEAWNNYGSTLGILKRYDESIKAFTRAMQLDPANPVPVLYSGYTYQAMGDSLQARVYLEKAYAMNPALRK